MSRDPPDEDVVAGRLILQKKKRGGFSKVSESFQKHRQTALSILPLQQIPINTKIMFNEYYPENTSPDCFENYGGHHIDDRMRARGNSYACRRQTDDKAHYATPEMMEEKRIELESLEAEYDRMHAAIYGNGSERLSGNDLADALGPLEALSEKISMLSRFIATAQVINPEERACDRVQMLSRVTVRIQGMPTTRTIRIVGENDSDPQKCEISCSSPVGKSLLGRKVGESVDVVVDGRIIRYIIISL